MINKLSDDLEEEQAIEMEEMEDIRREIDNAARTQEIVQAIARTIAFIGKRFI